MGRIIAISTNKGGVLKTSLVTNIAGVLSKTHRVLIVDTDYQGNSLLTFGVSPRTLDLTLYDVLAEGVKAESVVTNVHENIDIVPSNKDLSLLEFNMMSNPSKYPNPFKLLKTALEPLVDRYDYVLVDTPPNMGLIQANVLSFVEEVIIPFQPETYSRLSLIEMLEFIADFQKRDNPKLSVLGIVGTLVDFRTTLHEMIMADCQKYCTDHGLRMFKTSIPRSIRFASTVAFHSLPATLVDSRKHQIVNKYFNLAREVEESVKQRENVGVQHGGLDR